MTSGEAPFSAAEALARHQQRAEVLVGLLQLAVVTLFGALYFAAPMAFRSGMGAGASPVPVALAVYAVLTTARLLAARRGPLPPAVLHGSILLDFLVLYGLIWSFHLQYGQPPAFYLKAPTLLYVFIFIALRTLRLEARYVLAAGAAAALGWLGLAGYAVWSHPDWPVTRDYVAYMTSSTVLVGAEVDKVVAIIVVTGVLALAVRRGRAILDRQVRDAAENARLLAEATTLNRRLAEEVREREAAQAALHLAAYFDPLTGLGNRLWLAERLEARLSRGGQGVAVLLLDVDRFAALNDTLGHELGDRTLRGIADRLRAGAPEGADVARLGADSFAVAADCGTAGLEALHTALAGSRGTGEGAVSLSAGLATAVAGETAEGLLRDADIALHQARAGARGRLVRFDPAQRAGVAQRLALEADLRGAHTRGEVSLHYQPIVRLSDGGLAGFEALMRWTRPGHGPVSPVQFIPVAEETGQIVALGAWALREAAAAHRRLRLGGAFMGVNLSARQLAEEGALLAALDEALAHCPRGLKLEVTESLVVEDPDRAAALLGRLRDRGVTLAVDDFGTGYSSLGQLGKLPVHTLKVDRSFVDAMDTAAGRQVVSTIIRLAEGLGLDTVAEGVETAEQRDLLRSLGCTYGQGWLFGKPKPEAEVVVPAVA